jgi:hypothetical protein
MAAGLVSAPSTGGRPKEHPVSTPLREELRSRGVDRSNREVLAPGKELLGALDFKRLRYVMVRS